MTYPAANPCPCGSGKTFAECCGPILGGEAKAKTAERLMRARYTAYATDDIDFLFQSSGPEVREEFDRLNRLYGHDRDVNMDLAEYATRQIISELSYSYADLLKTYPIGQVRLLKAIAREGCVKEILSGNFISSHAYHISFKRCKKMP